MMNLRLLGVMIRDGVTGATLLDVFKNLELDYKKLTQLANSRRPRFFVDRHVEENPFMYQAGGVRIDFHYYDFTETACGRTFCILKNADKVTVGTLTNEACKEFERFIGE